ncbi:TA system VapC family ribonuclease toxin [Pseudonocardia sp. HH130630-07]|uniref:TA system VapC family ribonuclease toxin n=1 Tax=Pseudonocardia sp. HH130630-07 TaxID=1690815 RepID=UPI000814FE9A|nr:TA system VapC family ribonuclease toxin [Pseudonocardia sp. HH130630-07]ANY06020.1 ribonuclease [Pseudonocardia sp. HH130630-07]
MTTYLLDANVLIALTVAEHEHHDRASSWASGIERFAVCPVVEGALVRFLVRTGEPPSVATAVLRAVRALPGCEFWPDSLSYVDAGLDHVRGHRQVTDAYLASLAGSRPGSLLATLDEGLAREVPELTVLVPCSRPVPPQRS